MSSNCLLLQTNSSKPKDNQFVMIKKNKKTEKSCCAEIATVSETIFVVAFSVTQLIITAPISALFRSSAIFV